MARIDIKSAGGGSVATGVLQLENGVAMDATLRNVADQNNTTSPLKLSTTAVQVVSPFRITTDDPSDMYLDCEDGSTNNRFNITRNTASQQVNLNFASNPGGSTTVVGGIRTYVDGVNLTEVMKFREDGQLQIGSTAASAMYWDNVNNRLGVGTNAPTATEHIVGSSNTATDYAVKVLNLANQGILSVTNDGFTQIGDFTGAGYGANLSFLRSSGGTRATTFNQGNQNLSITNVNGNVTFQNTPVTVIGSGSTSATTSLLVQNSAGTQALRMRDDRVLEFSSLNNIIHPTNIRGGITDGMNILFNNGFTICDDSETRRINMPYVAGIRIPDTSNYPLTLGSDTKAVASAQLEMVSTTQGFLPPRMTTTQKNAISSPAAGLMVYDTTLNKLCVYTTAWETITSI